MNRERVRDRAAKAAYRAARRLGVQIDFTNSPGVDEYAAFWGFVTANERRIGLLGGETDIDGVEFIIPRQTNFPPTEFVPGAQIRYPITTGNVFSVIEVTGDNEDELQSSTFTLKCSRFGDCTVEIDE